MRSFSRNTQGSKRVDDLNLKMQLLRGRRITRGHPLGLGKPRKKYSHGSQEVGDIQKVSVVSNMKCLRDVYTTRRLEKESLCLAIKK